MKNKKLLIAVIAFAAVLGLFLGIYFGTRPNTDKDHNDQTGTTEATRSEDSKVAFVLTVVHANGESTTFEISSDETYLAPALIAEGIITDEGIETGMYNLVDGEIASWEQDQAYWAFYIDGEYAVTGLNDTPIEEGAEYCLEYTK